MIEKIRFFARIWDQVFINKPRWLLANQKIIYLNTLFFPQSLSNEILPFLCSGAHVIQKDCHPSALHTFVEALTQCHPQVPIRPCIMKYLGKSHNLWYRMTLMLEQAAHDHGALNVPRSTRRELDTSDGESINSPQQEIIDSLSEIYSVLKEEDLWAGLWQTVAQYPETRLVCIN